MWFFDWFKTYFGRIEDKFNDIGRDIGSVPVLGSYLSYPFRVIASYFANLKTASRYASSWCDDTDTELSNTFNSALRWVNELWRETDRIWRRIGAIPILTKDVIIGWVMPYIEYVKRYAENLVSNTIRVFDAVIIDIIRDINTLNDWIANSADIINERIDKSKDKVLGWIEDSFISIIERVMEHEKK